MTARLKPFERGGLQRPLFNPITSFCCRVKALKSQWVILNLLVKAFSFHEFPDI